MARHLGDHLKIAVIILLIAAIGYNLLSEESLFKLSDNTITGATTSPVTDLKIEGSKIFNAVLAMLVLLLIGLGGYYLRVRRFFNSTNSSDTGNETSITGSVVGVDPDLLFYIKEAKKVGYAERDIHARLLKAGWRKSDIKSAMKATEQKK